jgi:hypothetical protein
LSGFVGFASGTGPDVAQPAGAVIETSVNLAEIRKTRATFCAGTGPPLVAVTTKVIEPFGMAALAELSKRIERPDV